MPHRTESWKYHFDDALSHNCLNFVAFFFYLILLVFLIRFLHHHLIDLQGCILQIIYSIYIYNANTSEISEIAFWRDLISSLTASSSPFLNRRCHLSKPNSFLLFWVDTSNLSPLFINFILWIKNYFFCIIYRYQIITS